MGTRVDRDVILAALRLRYDYYSAENVLAAALDRAGLAGVTGFDGAQLGQLRGALERVGDRLDRVLAELDALGAVAPTPTRAPAAVVDAAPVAAVVDAAPVVAAAPAAVVAAAPAAEPAVAPAAEAAVASAAEAAVAPAASVAAAASVTAAASVAPAAPVTAAPAAEAAVAVTIAITGVEVADGAEVLVCGSAPALGAWDPDKAARMELAGDTWTTTIAVAPEAELAFKFLHRGPDGDVVWEAGGNRVAPARGRIDATWRAA
ncbi:MAG: hypothetical protein IPL61_30280 [Myxococcales bacterium]|nr:hypothetical protein [Myxococcales bacterium]